MKKKGSLNQSKGSLNQSNKTRNFWLLTGLLVVLLCSIMTQFWSPSNNITRPFYGLHSWADAHGPWLARVQVKHGFGYTKGLYTWAVGDPPTENPSRYLDHPQLPGLLNAAAMAVLGINRWALRATNVAATVVALLLFLKILRRLLDDKTALLAGLLFCLFPLIGYFGVNMWLFPLSFWAIWCYLVLIKGLKDGPKPSVLHKCGLAAGLFFALQMSWEGFFLALAVGVHYVFRCIHRRQFPEMTILTILIIAPLSSLILNFAIMARGYGIEVYRVKNIETAEYEFFQSDKLPKDHNKYDLDNRKLVVRSDRVYRVKNIHTEKYEFFQTDKLPKDRNKYDLGNKELVARWNFQKIIELYKWRADSGELKELTWPMWFGRFWEHAITNFTPPILITTIVYLTFGQLFVFMETKPNKRDKRRPRQFPHFWLFLMPAIFQLFILRGALWPHQTWERPLVPFIAIAAAEGVMLLGDALRKINKIVAYIAMTVLVAVFAIFCIIGVKHYYDIRWHAPAKIEMFEMLQEKILSNKALLSWEPFKVNQHKSKGSHYRPEIAWHLDREIVQAGIVKNRKLMVAETLKDIEQKAGTGKYPYYLIPQSKPLMPLITQLAQRYQYQQIPGEPPESTKDGKFLRAGMMPYFIFDLHSKAPGS